MQSLNETDKSSQELSIQTDRLLKHAPESTLRSSGRLVIRAGEAEKHYWRDLWRYRELFQVLAWRDVAVRYKQTVIGIAWAFLRPFLTMARVYCHIRQNR